jgi:flap endonuclease-1
MAIKGDVWAASSKDYDSLLFGAPNLLRYLTISGREFLPSKGTSRPLEPELIELNKLLASYGITREQLVDVALLIGTDFNEGVKGIGPKTALNLIRKHSSLEKLPANIRLKLEDQNHEAVRGIYLHPEVTSDYTVKYNEMNEDELFRFLCEKREFSRSRVETVVQRMRVFHKRKRQAELKEWFNTGHS